LSLLLPGEGDSESTGTGDTGDVDELRTKLALAEEELEASRIENRELESRISELQARLSKVEELQKMVEIEDDSLAQMQADQVEQAEQEATEGIEEIETEAADAVGETLSRPTKRPCSRSCSPKKRRPRLKSRPLPKAKPTTKWSATKWLVKKPLPSLQWSMKVSPNKPPPTTRWPKTKR
jgi:hypothetical protein